MKRSQPKPGDSIQLPDRGGMPESVHVIDEPSILAVNAAIAARRPLLVRGEPGTGKSQLARAASEWLGRAFVPHSVDGRTEPRDLLYTVDAFARLAEAQLLGALKSIAPEDAIKRTDVLNFVHPGPLWWAFDWESAVMQAKAVRVLAPVPPSDWSVGEGVVVLVDEIDKADSAIPNGLLDALGHGRFDVPGRNEPVAAKHAPLVVVTTNEERALPDAFLRRCLVLHLSLPESAGELKELLVARGQAHFPTCPTSVLEDAADLLVKDREEIRRRDLGPPGLAEYIDLVRAVVDQVEGEVSQRELVKKIAAFTLQKHPPEAKR